MQSWWSASASAQGETDFAVLRRRFVEASRRAEILAVINAARTEAEVAHAVVDELSEAFDAEIAFVIAIRPERGERETIGQTGLPARAAAEISADPLCRAALGATRAAIHAGDDLLGTGARHVALSPWTAENGRQVVIGVARLYDQRFEPGELALLEAVTAGVGHGLERAWSGEESDRHAARQSSLARAAHTVSASLVGREVQEALCREVADALEADVVVVYELDGRGRPTVVAGTGLPSGALGRHCTSDDALCAEVARGGVAVAWQPFESRVLADLPGSPALRSGLAAPIRANRRVSGIVVVAYHGDRWIEREDTELLDAFAELGGIACSNAADHAAAQRAASLDSLTGCLNHGAFQDRLREEIARAERMDSKLALALVDLDDFKAVNDSFGHLAGDALLRGVAEALRDAVRSYDQVARYGGDEFVVLLPETDDGTARRVIDRALAQVAAVHVAVDRPVSATAGLAHWKRDVDANTLIAQADEALLESKRSRRRGVPPAPPAPAVLEEIAGRRERERLRRLATAAGFGSRLGRLLDPQSIAETTVADLHSALGYEESVLVRRDGDDDLQVVAGGRYEPQRGRPGDEENGNGGHPGSAVRRPVTGVTRALRRCVLERRTVLEDQAADGARGTAGHQAFAGCELAVPVYAGAGLWGALGVRSVRRLDFDDDDAQLVQSVADQLGAALRTAQVYEQLDRTHLGTATALAAALEGKGEYGTDHARSMAELSMAVGRRLGLGSDALRDVRYGAIFHDIGKVAIPDAILSKPEKLTEGEFEVVRRHPAVAEQILAPVPFLEGVRHIVRHDHEHWDGSGYPDGLAGEEIPLGARIVLVVDAYHAMRSARPYRAAMDRRSARAELLRHAGTQFDPQVVQALLAVLEAEPTTEVR